MIDWPVPKSLDELRDLPVKRKGEWEGNAWLMAGLVWLGYLGPLVAGVLLGLLLSPWWFLLTLANVGTAYISRVFMYDFHTVWFGTTWASKDSKDLAFVAKRSGEHESVHDWHQQHVPWYKLKYTFPVPVWRREAEGLAYALDVLRNRRTRENAAESFSHWIYFQFLTKKKALQILERCEQKWRDECDDIAAS